MTGNEPDIAPGRQRAVRRWTRHALVCVALGVVMNIGVAWVLACTVRPDTSSLPINRGYRGRPYRGWDAACEQVPGAVGVWAILKGPLWGGGEDAVVLDSPRVPQGSASLPEWSLILQTSNFDAAVAIGLPDGVNISELANGLPVPCLVSRWYWDMPTASYCPPRSLLEGIPTGFQGRWDEPILLPVYPLPTPFLINTAFYATLVLIAALSWRLLRNRWRQCNRCPKCRYDLAGLSGAICPECGTRQTSTGPAAIPA